jgi:DNA-binding transcriptional MerR regulator
MLIGRVSELTGATRKAIRHYESIGLIREPERNGTYRIYSEHDVTVIGMIRQAQILGFSLKELKEIVFIKTREQAVPVDLVASLIDEKIVTLKQEVEQLKLKEKNLKKFKMDFFKEFS